MLGKHVRFCLRVIPVRELVREQPQGQFRRLGKRRIGNFISKCSDGEVALVVGERLGKFRVERSPVGLRCHGRRAQQCAYRRSFSGQAAKFGQPVSGLRWT